MTVPASYVAVASAMIVVVVVVAAVAVSHPNTGQREVHRAVAFCRSISRQERKILLYAPGTLRARRSQTRSADIEIYENSSEEGLEKTSQE